MPNGIGRVLLWEKFIRGAIADVSIFVNFADRNFSCICRHTMARSHARTAAQSLSRENVPRESASCTEFPRKVPQQSIGCGVGLGCRFKRKTINSAVNVTRVTLQCNVRHKFEPSAGIRQQQFGTSELSSKY